MVNNILIIGITGSGKSTLTNVLTDTNLFEESNLSTSKTKIFQKSHPFEWKGANYCIIDNIGFGDTDEITEKEILYEIGKGIYLTKEGINQVLFVFKDKFSSEQIMNFNSFKELISGSGITKFTTLVRTRFDNFKNRQECEKDRQVLLNENIKINELIKSCKSVLHVNNPPIPVIDEEEDSEDEIEDKKGKISRGKEERKESRKIVFDHLTENCNGVYKLKGWDNIHSIVAEYIKKEEEIEKSDNLVKKEELKKLKNDAVDKIKLHLEPELVAAIEYTTHKA